MSTLLKIAKIAKANLLTKLIITEPIRNSGHFEKNDFEKKYLVNEVVYDHGKTLTLMRKKEYNNHIIYLHGGAYTDEAILLHRVFIERILKKYQTKVTFIDYPLTPEYDYKEIQEFTKCAIIDLLNKNQEDYFFIIGDSAGGGLAISMLQQLKNDRLKKTILLSPWVDVSMTNPDINLYIKKDFTLNLDSLINCGKKYAGDLSTKSEVVSPVYGDLNNLGKILIYTCDNELLYPDILKFSQLVNASDNSISTIVVAHDLCHDYPLLIIKETRGIIKEMMEFLHINKK